MSERFIQVAIRAEAEGRPKMALDIMADNLDRLLVEGRWDALDLILALNPDFLSCRLMLSILVMLKPAEAHLPHYGDFRERCQVTLESRGEMKPGILEEP